MELVKQEFSGAVGEVAGRDIVNHHHTHGRLLTKIERIELNKLVQRLEGEFGEPGWQTWKFLHRTIGVESIDDMCLGHRDQAETILQLLMDRATYKLALGTQSAKVSQQSDGTVALVQRNGDLTNRVAQLQQAYSALEKRLERANSLVIGASKTDKKLFWVKCLVAAGFVMVALLGYRTVLLQSRLKVAQAHDEVCELDDQVFAIGSVVDQRNAPDLQCTAVANQPAQWYSLKMPAVKKNPIIQRRPKQPIVQE